MWSKIRSILVIALFLSAAFPPSAAIAQYTAETALTFAEDGSSPGNTVGGLPEHRRAVTNRLIVSDSGQSIVPEPIDELDPPTDFRVSDVPDDQGHHLSLTWTRSLSENKGLVRVYRIFRSRSAILTDPAPLSRFTSIEELNTWEAGHTVLTDSVAAGVSEYIDFVPMNGTTYYYWVQAVGPSGASKPTSSDQRPVAVEDADETPGAFRVSAPSPNPFNPATTIRYEIPERCAVRIVVFDRLGRKVAVLEDGMLNSGPHEAVWNGRSETGTDAASGIYLYRIEAGAHSARGKMTLLR